MNLKDDAVTSAYIYKDANYLLIATDKGTFKRIKMSDLKELTRGKRGTRIIREVITNPYKIVKAFLVSQKEIICFKVSNDITSIKLSEVPITDLSSTGTVLSKKIVENVFIEKSLEEKIEIETSVNLNEIDEQIDMIDSLLKEL